MKSKGTWCRLIKVTELMTVFALLSSASILTADAADIEVFGLHHSPLGNAHLDIVDTNLVVSNIGSSGADGVATDIGMSFSWKGKFVSSLRGGSLTIDGFGQINGVSNRPLATSILQSTAGSNTDITADFHGADSPLQIIEIYDGTNLVAGVIDHTNGTAAVRVPDTFLTNCAVAFQLEIEFPALVARAVHPNQCVFEYKALGGTALIAIAGGPTVTGDRIRIVEQVIEARPPFDFFSQMRIQAKDVSSFTIYAEAVGFSIPPEGVPRLSITHTQTNVILAWPDPSIGFQVQATVNLNGPGTIWTNVTQTPIVVGESKQMILPGDTASSIYRLRKL